jgi:myo-inositol-1(or 4)-monophosphatase
MTQSRLSAVTEVAKLTGEVLRSSFAAGKNSGKMKSDHTLVTEADHQADELIQELIQRKFPGEGILSEENSTVFPDTEHTWVIDPLDGTVNFSKGLLYWGVSVAHLVNGLPRNGAIYFPMIDEMYTASSGNGAFLNNEPLSVKQELDDEKVPLFVHCSRMQERYSAKVRYKKRSLGAATYHLCLAANNTAALVLESTPRIWDIAAGWLIIEEAGAVIQTLGSEPPFPAQPGVDYAKKPYPILAARSPAILAEARRSIQLI